MIPDISCHCREKCGRFLRVRDGKLWFFDEVMDTEEQVTQISDGFINNKWSMSIGSIKLAKEMVRQNRLTSVILVNDLEKGSILHENTQSDLYQNGS